MATGGDNVVTHQAMENMATASVETWMEIGRKRKIKAPKPWERPWLELGPGESPVGAEESLGLDDGWDFNASGVIPMTSDRLFGTIIMHGFIDYIEDPVRLLWECSRLLGPGGTISIIVPHGMSELARSDIHKKGAWTEKTFRNLLENPYYHPPGMDLPLKVYTEFILGVEWRNLSLFTQLVKEVGD